MHQIDNFHQLRWRPRPRTLLSKEKQRQVRKNLKEYSRAFDEEDAAEESSMSAEQIAERRRLVGEWNAWRERVQREEGAGRRKGKNNTRGEGEGEAQEEIEVEVEEIIDEKEEFVDE